jgi:hypothetical protein
LPAILLGSCSSCAALQLLLLLPICCVSSTCGACMAVVLGACTPVQRLLLLVLCLGCRCGGCCRLRLCSRCGKVPGLQTRVKG